jgi:hypothetical protein
VPLETSGETLEQGGEQHGTSFEDRACGEREIYRSEQIKKSSSMALLSPQRALRNPSSAGNKTTPGLADEAGQGAQEHHQGKCKGSGVEGEAIT